jgi:hypothetical protein
MMDDCYFFTSWSSKHTLKLPTLPIGPHVLAAVTFRSKLNLIRYWWYFRTSRWQYDTSHLKLESETNPVRHMGWQATSPEVFYFEWHQRGGYDRGRRPLKVSVTNIHHGWMNRAGAKTLFVFSTSNQNLFRTGRLGEWTLWKPTAL